MDFDSERISSNLEKLEDQNRKIYSFFNDYEKYKDRQENLKMFYLNFANLFHYRENFPAEIATYMKELEEIDLPFWIHEPKSKPILKRLLVESKLWILILYSSAVILSIWIGLDYVYPDYSVQNKITVTAMLIGGAIIQFIFKRPKSVVQSEKSSDK